jgi:hypothetical protein
MSGLSGIWNVSYLKPILATTACNTFQHIESGEFLVKSLKILYDDRAGALW